MPNLPRRGSPGSGATLDVMWPVRVTAGVTQTPSRRNRADLDAAGACPQGGRGATRRFTAFARVIETGLIRSEFVVPGGPARIVGTYSSNWMRRRRSGCGSSRGRHRGRRRRCSPARWYRDDGNTTTRKRSTSPAVNSQRHRDRLPWSASTWRRSASSPEQRRRRLPPRAVSGPMTPLPLNRALPMALRLRAVVAPVSSATLDVEDRFAFLWRHEETAVEPFRSAPWDATVDA